MDSHVADVWFRVTDLEVVSGAGAVVTAADGSEYLDFTSGIGVVNTGHCHPAVVAAIRDQAGRFIHAAGERVPSPAPRAARARLADVTPDGIERFFYANSGAEAVEGAVKLARQVTGRPHLIVFQGSFHGRTAADDGDDHIEDRLPRRPRSVAGRCVRRAVPEPVLDRRGRCRRPLSGRARLWCSRHRPRWRDRGDGHRAGAR